MHVGGAETMAESELTPEELARQEAKRVSERARLKKYYAHNRERVRARANQRCQLNPEKHRTRASKWHKKNPEKARAKAKKYRKNNLERVRAKGRVRTKKWYKNNPERVRTILKASGHRRRSRLQSSPINDLTPAEIAFVIAQANGRCPYCPPTCKSCKRGSHTLTIDHLTAVANGGPNTLHNVIAVCKSCNSSKGTRPVPKPVQPFLLAMPAGND